MINLSLSVYISNFYIEPQIKIKFNIVQQPKINFFPCV